MKYIKLTINNMPTLCSHQEQGAGILLSGCIDYSVSSGGRIGMAPFLVQTKADVRTAQL